MKTNDEIDREIDLVPGALFERELRRDIWKAGYKAGQVESAVSEQRRQLDEMRLKLHKELEASVRKFGSLMEKRCALKRSTDACPHTEPPVYRPIYAIGRETDISAWAQINGLQRDQVKDIWRDNQLYGLPPSVLYNVNPRALSPNDRAVMAAAAARGWTIVNVDGKNVPILKP